jgi:hypothetical protein
MKNVEQNNIENAREVYRQRYETWRHLDKLRWNMVQFLIALTSIVAIALRFFPGGLGAWSWLLIGTSVISLSLAMNKVSQGIVANSEMLNSAGKKVGDTRLPEVSDQARSVYFYITVLVGVVGFILAMKGLFLFGVQRK